MNIQVLCPEGHPVLIHAGRLGGEVACPRCFACFVAQNNIESRYHAVPEKGKARPARDDDDDDEDEAPPQKKVKASPPKKKKEVKDEKSDEKESPKAKKPVRKKRDEEDEDDEDEEEEDDEDEEEEPEEEVIEIEWTPRKRQLNVVRNSLVSYITAFWTMVGATLLVAVIVGINLMVQFGIPMVEFIPWAVIAILALIAIAYIALLVGWIMCFWAPAKADMRTNLILAIIFLAMPAFLLVLSGILTATEQFRNPEVAKNFGILIGAGCAASLFISLFFGLVSLGKLCIFMGDKKLSSQPVTLGFGLIGFTVLIAALIHLHSLIWTRYSEPKPDQRNDIYNYLAYGVIGVSLGVLFFLLRTLHGHVGVCQVLRKHIKNYIETQ